MTGLDAVKLAAAAAMAAVADLDGYAEVADHDSYALGLAEGLATAVNLLEEAAAEPSG
jgi:hypothetical protein